MALMEWNDRFSVGINTFDNHHKKLVQMLNALHAAMREGQGSDVLGKLLSHLVVYTQQHFAAEEKVMKLHGYPEFEAHHAEHVKLTDQVLDLKAQFDSGKTMLSLKVMNFLKDWLTTHILQTDMKYEAFLTAKGVK